MLHICDKKQVEVGFLGLSMAHDRLPHVPSPDALLGDGDGAARPTTRESGDSRVGSPHRHPWLMIRGDFAALTFRRLTLRSAAGPSQRDQPYHGGGAGWARAS